MDFWERPKEPEIRQVLPMVNGLFYHMNYTFKAGITKSELDTLFISSYGKRNLAPLIDLIAEKYDLPNDEPLTDAALQELASLVLGMYKIKWDKQGEIPDIEYDPIHNYLHEWEDAEEGSRSTQSSEQRESSYSNDSTNTINNGVPLTFTTGILKCETFSFDSQLPCRAKPLLVFRSPYTFFSPSPPSVHPILCNREPR